MNLQKSQTEPRQVLQLTKNNYLSPFLMKWGFFHIINETAAIAAIAAMLLNLLNLGKI